jgi:hypothetical protein
LSICLSIHLSFFPSIHPTICLSVHRTAVIFSF